MPNPLAIPNNFVMINSLWKLCHLGEFYDAHVRHQIVCGGAERVNGLLFFFIFQDSIRVQPNLRPMLYKLTSH